LFEARYQTFLDPSSITLTAEERVFDGTPPSLREANLADVSDRIEKTQFQGYWPYRRP
jgi:hypothetical protein